MPAIRTAFAAMLILLAVSSTSEAQCNHLFEGCSPQAHEAPPDGSVIGSPSHTTCNLCPDGNPYDCHFSCFRLSSSDSSAAYNALLAAAESSDVARVISLASALGEHVRFNPRRQSIQILSCSGDGVIATLPVPGSALLAAASRLRPVEPLASLAFTVGVRFASTQPAAWSTQRPTGGASQR